LCRNRKWESREADQLRKWQCIAANKIFVVGGGLCRAEFLKTAVEVYKSWKRTYQILNLDFSIRIEVIYH
jgi:hypothetical protein